MAQNRNYYSDRDVKKQRGVNRRVLAGKTSSRPPPTRRVPRGGGGGGRIIYAQVNEASGVGSGDTTFAFDNAIALVGSIPTGGTGTAENQYAQTYANNEWVILSQRKDNQQWLTERGGTAGSALVHFELTEDMAYADTSKLAKPVNDDGTLDTGATAFNVVDMRAVDTAGDFGQFYGKAGYTDADGGAVVWSGYQGVGLRFADNWNETGLPGYKIITLEDPMDFWIGTCAESLTSGHAKATYDTSLDVSGGPFSGRRPPLLADSRVTVYDDLNIKPTPGKKYWIKWDKKAAHYIYDRKVSTATEAAGPGFCLTTSTIDARTWSTPTLTPGTGQGYLFISNDDGTWTLDDSEEVDFYNSSTETIASGRIEQFKIIDGFRVIDVDDCD